LNRKVMLVPVLMLLISSCSPVDATPTLPATLPPPGVTTYPAPDPGAAVSAFLDAWQEREFEGMYAMLSPLAQEQISEEDFVARYEEITRLMALAELDYEIFSDFLMNPQEAQVAFRITYRTAVAGDLVRENIIDLQRDDDAWRIAWEETDILPDLEGDKGLYLAVANPQRANIYDRNGLALASPANMVTLWISPNQVGDEDAESLMLRSLSRLLDMHPESIQALYDDIRHTNWRVNLGEVSLEEFQREQGNLFAAGGVQWAEYSGRYYHGNGIAEHVVGYVAQITEEEADEYQQLGYLGDEFVGQIGIEAAYEEQLRGIPAATLYRTDGSGTLETVLTGSDGEPPFAVYTTLDRNLQREATYALQGFTGAIVVLERDTGAVLAMVSSPGFDPHLFDWHNPSYSSGLADLFDSTGQPLLNRATHGLYPLGSVFKVITMSAALESELYTPSTTYSCNGEFRELPGEVFYDWTVEKDYPPHGTVSLTQGLERSCNPYFWHIGLDLFNQGLTTALPDMARGFGLGEPTGIEIPELGGLVPDPEWTTENLGHAWGPGDAVQLAIGQGGLNVTPLQVARFMAALGNGGTLYRPQLIQSIENAEGLVQHEFQPDAQAELPLSEDTLNALHQAMYLVTSSPMGTANRILRYPGTFPILVAGKTGTAEVGGDEDPHSWFAGYTFEERDDIPDIAIAVIVENQGEGSEWAAPIFRRVVEAYFYGQPFRLYPWESDVGVVRTETPTPGPGTETPEP
jgi:penicillin-binding protein 2